MNSATDKNRELQSLAETMEPVKPLEAYDPSLRQSQDSHINSQAVEE